MLSTEELRHTCHEEHLIVKLNAEDTYSSYRIFRPRVKYRPKLELLHFIFPHLKLSCSSNAMEPIQSFFYVPRLLILLHKLSFVIVWAFYAFRIFGLDLFIPLSPFSYHLYNSLLNKSGPHKVHYFRVFLLARLVLSAFLMHYNYLNLPRVHRMKRSIP